MKAIEENQFIYELVFFFSFKYKAYTIDLTRVLKVLSSVVVLVLSSCNNFSLS